MPEAVEIVRNWVCKINSKGCAKLEIQYIVTGAWSGTDTLANCNKVEHDKI